MESDSVFNYEELLEQLDGDAELCAELATDTLADSGERIGRVTRLLAEDDPDLESVAREAHALKGTAGSMCASELHDASAALLDAARGGGVDDTRARAAEMTVHLERLHKAFEARGYVQGG